MCEVVGIERNKRQNRTLRSRERTDTRPRATKSGKTTVRRTDKQQRHALPNGKTRTARIPRY